MTGHLVGGCDARSIATFKPDVFSSGSAFPSIANPEEPG